MSRFEYKIVKMDEPSRPRGVLEGRSSAYVQAMSGHMNELAKTGWEYVRSDSLTTKRVTFFGRSEETLSVLVFRRPFAPDRMSEPQPISPQPDGSVLHVAFNRDRNTP